MKRMLASLLALLSVLLCPVLCRAEMVSIAQLREQAEAMGRWKKTYRAHGRTVEVDVPILVPDAAACPALAVDIAVPLTDEQIDAIVSRGEARAHCTYVLGDSDVPLTVMLSSRMSADPYARDAVWLYRGRHEYLAMNPVSQGDLPKTFLRAWQTDMDAALAEGNDVTPREVTQRMAQMLAGVYPHDTVTFAPVRFTAVGMEHRADDRHDSGGRMWTEFGERVESNDTPGYIELCAAQTLSGLPVLSPISYYMKYIEREWAKIGERLDSLALMQPSLELDYMAEDAYYLRVQALRATQTLAPDLPLAPLSVILETLEREIEAGRIRAVGELRLGYALYWTREGSACVYPIWEALCGYEPSVQTEWQAAERAAGINGVDPFQIGIFTRVGINAQTGALYDPAAFDPDLLTCPELVGNNAPRQTSPF